MAVNPADIARITYEDNRSRVVAQLPVEQQANFPEWDKADDATKDTVITSLTYVLEALRANGYDIVRTEVT